MFRHLALFAFVASLGSSSVAHHCQHLNGILAACSANKTWAGTADCLKKGIDLVCDHPRVKDLRTIKTACNRLTEYEGDAKCLQSGIKAVIHGQGYFQYTPTICSQRSTFEGSNNCFREMIGAFGDSEMNALKQLCIANKSYEGEYNCYRKLFQL